MQFVSLLLVMCVILRAGKANKKYCVAACLDMQGNSKVECILVEYSWLLWVYLKLPYNYHMHWGKYVQ